MKRVGRARGVTMLEAMATLAVLALGTTGVVALVVESARQNRRTLSNTQAQMVAEQLLERIKNIPCTPPDDPQGPCANIQAFDDQTFDYYWSADGRLSTEAPAPGAPGQRRFFASVDVDPPWEGTERGQPALTRAIANGAAGNLVNVRVTVTWHEPDRPRQAVVLQTRMSP